MLEVKKRPGETLESLQRRFSRRVLQSRILLRARKHRYFERTKSRNLRRRAALKRAVNRKVREEQKRFGPPAR